MANDNREKERKAKISNDDCVLLNWLVLKEIWHVINKNLNTMVAKEGTSDNKCDFYNTFEIGSSMYTKMMEGYPRCYTKKRITEICERSGIEEAIFKGEYKLLDVNGIDDSYWGQFVADRKSSEGGKKGYAQYSKQIKEWIKQELTKYQNNEPINNSLMRAFYFVKYGVKVEDDDRLVANALEGMKNIPFNEIFLTNRVVLAQYRSMLEKHIKWIDASVITVDEMKLSLGNLRKNLTDKEKNKEIKR